MPARSRSDLGKRRRTRALGRPLLLVTAALVATLVWTACGGSEGGGPTGQGPVVTRVEVTPTDASAQVGGTVSFSARAFDQEGAPISGSATWSSSNTAVATIGASGTATAVGAGTTTIRATIEGRTGTATLQVTAIPVAALTLDPTSATVQALSSVQITATPRDANGNPLAGRTITWSSNDSNVATVDPDGEVTGVSEGSATITATSEGLSATAAITVTPAPVATVFVTPADSQVQVGASVQLVADPRDAADRSLTGRAVTWASSDESVATVDGDGTVTAVAVGTAEITATSEGVSGTAAVEVVPVPVDQVVVTPSNATVVIGGTASFAARTLGADGSELTGRTVTWSSSNAAVATVAQDGTVTGVAVGSATITATSEGVSTTATITVNAVPVASVEVSPATAEVQVGSTRQLTATLKDGSGNTLTGRTVTWTTSDASVATVGPSGLVTAASAGTATLTATSEGVAGTAVVTVIPVPVGTVEVSPPNASILVGATQQLTATLRDAGGATLTGRTVVWSTGDATVATVDANGAVTGVGAGTATITASSEGKSDTAAITVVLPPVETVEVSPATASIIVGATQQLTATLRDAQGAIVSGRTVVWSTNASGVATVDANGVVTGAGAGTATITASSEGKSDTAEITVTLPPVASVEVSPTAASLTVGGTQQLTATTKDAQGNTVTGRTVTWSSSNESVVTVDANGLVTAVAAGTATVRATSEGVIGTASVTVQTTPVNTVSVGPNNQVLPIGNTVQLTATLRDAGGNTLTGRTITWSTARADIATVDQNGLMTAAGYGTTTITASSEGKSGSVTVSGYEVATSGFDISLEFLEPVSAQDRTTFENAAARWEQIITADGPGANGNGFSCNGNVAEGTIDDVHIFVTVAPIDGVGGTLGSAGFCDFGSSLPFLGVMTFDSDDIGGLRTDGDLDAVIIHEMGHVLGIGTAWNSKGFQNPAGSSACQAASDPTYTGPLATQAFDDVGGTAYTGAKVPMANTGGTGTKCGHWREGVFDTELMTGYLDSGVSNPISLVTVQSLADIGYSVNTGAADAYSLPNPSLRFGPPADRGLDLGDDIWFPPAARVGPDGTLVPVSRGGG